MKKTNFLWSMLSIVMAAMLSVQLTSCGDDKDSVSVSSPSVNISENGGSQSVSITSNTSWSISGMPSWLTVSPMQGSQNGVISISASQNTTNASRSCSLLVSAGTASAMITVEQAGMSIPNKLTITNNSTYTLSRFTVVFRNDYNETITSSIRDFGTLSPGYSITADVPDGATNFYMATYLGGYWFYSLYHKIQGYTFSITEDVISEFKSSSSTTEFKLQTE